MKKIIILLTILLLCGCTQKLEFTDTKEYIYTNHYRDKVDKFVVETDTLLGKHCYEVNKGDALNMLDKIEIKKETKTYSTDSDSYYKIYFENGEVKTFMFNGENLFYNGKYYELENKKDFVLSNSIEIDCNNGKINHNLMKTNINDKYNLYYYEIDNVIYFDKEKEVDLDEALVNKDITIDDIVSHLKYDVGFYDGGTTIYKNNGVFKENLELLKCKTLDGNNDVYIGYSGMGYRNNFCLDNNRTFTKTYTIKSIEDYDQNQIENGVEVSYSKSLRVLLSDEINEEYVILNNFWDEIEVNKTYEFELMPHSDSNLEDNISSIFKNSTIVGTKETDKLGINQIQDDLYLWRINGTN